ncbi:unnamed protein product [Moneuplotes crassus]|uniref:Uncharacterized protein n=1 Tax=Euplotes crassus TaxID=5936 RepID=A0AAD1XIK3_EUPCR|nr:unnamed protein product [Moneuplotes crassus]|eukprot:CAMPEP_0197006686 /NCGR_PEP_ID=MMETSP1380-20130617/36425_1 /TAXON_ID=5936 /ORGANISM="Euplotes crassus, Strain CT5" /LENGTH=335 /DNA_ID=CAMNT_0042426371 /DNA_START=17 /DNA_END=1024 /DNA_ORIENTATION=+
MKALVLILMISFATFAQANAGVGPLDAAHFVDGFLRGALNAEIGEVDDCLTDADGVVSVVGKIVDDLSKGFNLASLIQDIGLLFIQIPKSLQECQNLPPVVDETFQKWTNTLSNPLKIAKIVGYALFKYRDQLVNDANTFVQDWNDGQFEESGRYLGDIPHVLFDLCSSPQPLKVTPIDVGYFLDGFLSSALQSEVADVESCITDADAIIQDIDKFVADISKGFDLLDIITDLGALFVDVPNSIKDCGDFNVQVAKLFADWGAKISNPITVAKIVYNTLAHYKDRVESDATGFVDEWNAQQYKHSGELLGDIPYVIFTLSSKLPLEETFVKGESA